MSTTLGRRMVAEAVATGLLVTAVIGSGIAAARLSPTDVGLQLLENYVATGAALAALILVFQPVSAALNPAITVLERAFGTIGTTEAAALVAAQACGGVLGAVTANLMFDLPAVSLSTHHRGGAALVFAEAVATFGLAVVVMGAVRSGRADRVGYAVAGYIMAAYWFTSSTSFANPAVTVARMLSDTFAGIAPASVPLFLLGQAAGGLAAYPLLWYLYPRPASRADHVPTGEDEHRL